jgi:hypothetical protein
MGESLFDVSRSGFAGGDKSLKGGHQDGRQARRLSRGQALLMKSGRHDQACFDLTSRTVQYANVTTQ